MLNRALSHRANSSRSGTTALRSWSGGSARPVGDEGNHIEHTQSRVRSLVRAEIEPGHGRRGQRPDRGGDVVDVADQGEDRTVMVGVCVQIEQDGSGRRGQFSQKNLVTTLAHVDHALDDHSWLRGSAAGQGVPPDQLADRDGL